MTKDFPSAVGETLGAVRRAQGLTLKDVERRSRGRFSASAVGGYERGERSISLDRFSALAALYGLPADGLLGEILNSLVPRRPVILDVTGLGTIDQGIGRRVGELIHRIRSQRDEYTADVVALRSGDVAAIALDLDLPLSDLLKRLEPVIVRSGPPQRSRERVASGPRS